MSRPRAIGLLLVLVTLLAYLPALRNGFVNLDDKDYVTQNPMVQHGFTWTGIRWAFTQWHASNWHPVTWLSHMADCALFRLDPAGHHLVNALLHAINTGLLFFLWWRLTNALWPGAIVAALFGWHPLHVESVAWVSERKDVLSAFFALLTLLCYVKHAKETVTGGAISASFKSGIYWAAVVLFAFSLMSKPMFVTLPFVMLLLDYWPLGRHVFGWKLLVEKWPFFLLSAGSCIVTIFAQRAEAIAPWTKFSLSLRLENVLTAYVGYLLKTIWPLNLAVFYPLPQHIPWINAAGAASLLVLISVAAVSQAQRRPYLIAGWLWYLGTLVPVIGLVQVGDQALADRYTYFPLIGIFFAAVWAAKDAGETFRLPNIALAAPAALALGACLMLTENQIRYWRDSETLFAHALAVTQDNAPAHLNLGATLQEQNRLDEALVEYRQVLKIDPRRHEVYNNIGRILSDQGKPAEALNYCQTAVTLDPRSAPAQVGLGIVLAELGRFDDALAHFSTAAQLDANNAAPHFQMARILLKMGRDADAVSQFHEALQIEPDNFQVLIHAARVLSSDEKNEARNATEAFAFARRAADLAGAQIVTLDTLAMACAEAARFDEATNLAQQAMDLAQAAGANDDATAIAQRLARYRQHQPWRQSFRAP